MIWHFQAAYSYKADVPSRIGDKLAEARDAVGSKLDGVGPVKLGVPSDVFYFASLGSIAASIVAWSVRNDKNVANAERPGIFIGLWALTFMLIGQGIHTLETVKGMSSPALEQGADSLERVATGARQSAEASVRS